jgi:dipeptidyl aminopeptidase/acylaminoacyl peptidase
VYRTRADFPHGVTELSPDGSLIATAADKDRVIHLLDRKTGKEIRQLMGLQDTVSVISFSPDGRFVLSGSADQTARVGGPAGITFQIAAVVMVVRERAGQKKKARHGKVGGPRMWERLMLLVVAEEVKRPVRAGDAKSACFLADQGASSWPR